MDTSEKQPWINIIGKILLFVLVLYFSNTLVFSPRPWIFIDGVNLLFHEAGHLLFYFLGETLSFLGGSVFQILIPFSILVYFLKREEYFSAFFALFWLGDNFINVAVYIKDATTMTLPLIGFGIHDWNFLLTKYNLLEQDQMIGNLFYYSGTVFLFLSLFFMAKNIAKDVIYSVNLSKNRL